MLMAVERHEDRVDVVLCGCARDELRQACLRVCAKRFGDGQWRVCEERFRPAMVRRTGSVRLWEARLELERSA